MARFQAEIPNNIYKNVVDYLDEINMTKVDFIKLAIKAKEQLAPKSANKSGGKAKPKKAEPKKKAVAKKVEPKKKAVAKKAVPKKKAPAKKKTESVKKSGKPAAANSMGKIIETNIKLYNRFADQARSKKVSLQTYAKRLGLDLKKVEKVRRDKSIAFIPKLKEALDRHA